MFENLKQQIAKDLLLNKIETLDDYVYELHEILPNYLKQVPEQSSYEFYEFAAKFLQYIIDEDLDILDNDSVCDVFITCPDEICEVTNALASQSGEDITSDIIKIISTAKSLNIVNTEEEAEIFLNSIFIWTNHDWLDMDNQYIHCNWNQVMLMTGFNDEDAEDPEFNDYCDIDQDILDTSEDDPNFGVDALFSFLCVTGPDSADQALEIIYNECGWVGHPEDEIKAGTDFPIYGIIDQEEADWFNANMNAIFEYYDGDPNEFALKCIDPEAVEDLENDFEPTGYRTTSNIGGREIQISDDGSMARIKLENGTITDWLEIQYELVDENGDWIENNSRGYIDITGDGDIEDFEFLDKYIKY